MASLWQYLEQPEGVQKQANVAGPSPEPPPANNMPSHEGMEPGTVPPADFLQDANATTPTLSEADLEKQAEAIGLLAADGLKVAADLLDSRQQQAHDNHLIEDQLIKIAQLDEATFEADWGEYVKMGRDTGLGQIGAYVKAAMDATDAEVGDQYTQALVEKVAEVMAEDLASRVPADALQDPQVVNEMTEDIYKAAYWRVDQMIADNVDPNGAAKEAMAGNQALRSLGGRVRKGLGRTKKDPSEGAMIEDRALGHQVDARNLRAGRLTAGAGAAGVTGAGAGGAAAMQDKNKNAAAIPGLSSVKNILTKGHEGIVGLGNKARQAVRGGGGEVDRNTITGHNWRAGTAIDDAEAITKNRQIGGALGYGAGGAATAATAAGGAAILGGNPLGTPHQ